MSENEAINPHTGEPLPADANESGEPQKAQSSPGAAKVSALAPPAAKQVGPPVIGSTPTQQELAVRSVLETVMDPEIGLSVIDLGLIREVHFVPGGTLVRMMLTTPFCPYASQMMADVKQATESVVPQDCEVEILADPWSPDMMPDPSLLGYSY